LELVVVYLRVKQEMEVPLVGAQPLDAMFVQEEA